MSDIKQLIEELRIIIASTGTPVVVRATQITDDLAGRYADFAIAHVLFSQIILMATKIKTSGATDGENGVMWGEVIRLVHHMLDA
jgi:hypothetical protein